MLVGVGKEVEAEKSLRVTCCQSKKKITIIRCHQPTTLQSKRLSSEPNPNPNHDQELELEQTKIYVHSDPRTYVAVVDYNYALLPVPCINAFKLLLSLTYEPMQDVHQVECTSFLIFWETRT